MHPACYQFPTFWLGSVHPQTTRIILCITNPSRVYFWLTVSGFGQTDPVRKQAGVQKSSGPLLANVSLLIRTGCESDPACLLGHFCSAYPTAWVALQWKTTLTFDIIIYKFEKSSRDNCIHLIYMYIERCARSHARVCVWKHSHTLSCFTPTPTHQVSSPVNTLID